jgi:hypothetical protein
MNARTARRRSGTRLVVMLSLSLTLAACQAHDPSRLATPGRIGVGDLVTHDELVASGATSLRDALVRTRRRFLTSRGVSSINNPPADSILVFHNGSIMGTLTVLDMLKPGDVRAVRRIGVTETFHRYGRFVSVGGLEVELMIDR